MKSKEISREEICDKFFKQDPFMIQMELGKYYLYELCFYDSAIDAFTKATRLKESAVAYAYLAKSHQKVQEHSEALKNLNISIQINPENGDAYHGRGMSYYWLQEYEKAIADYTKALEFKPEPYIFHNRALAYIALEKWELAVQDLTESIKLDSQYADSYADLAHCWGKLGEYDLALNDIDTAISLDSSNINYYATKAELAEMIYIGEAEKTKR